MYVFIVYVYVCFVLRVYIAGSDVCISVYICTCAYMYVCVHLCMFVRVNVRVFARV